MENLQQLNFLQPMDVCVQLASQLLTHVINKIEYVVLSISSQIAIQLKLYCSYMDLQLCTCSWLITLYSEHERIMHALLYIVISLASQLYRLQLQLQLQYIQNSMYTCVKCNLRRTDSSLLVVKIRPEMTQNVFSDQFNFKFFLQSMHPSSQA